MEEVDETAAGPAAPVYPPDVVGTVFTPEPEVTYTPRPDAPGQVAVPTEGGDTEVVTESTAPSAESDDTSAE